MQVNGDRAVQGTQPAHVEPTSRPTAGPFPGGVGQGATNALSPTPKATPNWAADPDVKATLQKEVNSFLPSWRSIGNIINTELKGLFGLGNFLLGQATKSEQKLLDTLTKQINTKNQTLPEGQKISLPSQEDVRDYLTTKGKSADAAPATATATIAANARAAELVAAFRDSGPVNPALSSFAPAAPRQSVPQEQPAAVQTRSAAFLHNESSQESEKPNPALPLLREVVTGAKDHVEPRDLVQEMKSKGVDGAKLKEAVRQLLNSVEDRGAVERCVDLCIAWQRFGTDAFDTGLDEPRPLDQMLKAAKDKGIDYMERVPSLENSLDILEGVYAENHQREE